MDANDVSDLFKREPCRANSVTELVEFLKRFETQRLEHPGNGNCNIGYIFRGEIGFQTPLQPSLERAWFDKNSDKDHCSAIDLLTFEKSLVESFRRDSEEIYDLAKKHADNRPKLPERENVFELLQFKQHYRTKTRLLDFTKNIRVALYFALEARKNYEKCKDCKKCGTKVRELELFVYCFPCIDVEKPKTGKDNKTPFVENEGRPQPDINLAIGCQMKLDCMQDHQDTFQKQYSNTKQSFGWDQAYHPNPRLSFQEGMLAYPYKADGITIQRNGPSWFIHCLRLKLSDPFNLGTVKEKLPPLMIHIPEDVVGHCIKYIQDDCGLTPAKIYLDCGRIGERLQL